jgi:DNA-binding protein YbaB
MNFYEQQAEELAAAYEAQRAKTTELRRKITEITGTATAPRKSVKATVSARGEVTAIEFPTEAYKRMPPKELSEVLLATIGQARDNALELVRDTMAAELPKGQGLNFIEMLKGTADMAAAAPAENDIPEFVRQQLLGGSSG